MSDDFISGLRGDLVDAVDRYQRRGRASRTRQLLPRVWRPAMAVATIVAGAVAVLFAAGALSPAPTVRPGITTRVQIGGQPQDAVLAGGSLWVTDFGGRVIRVDPRSGKVVERIAVGGHPQAIAAGDGAVWVTSPSLRGGADRSLLSRIDPRTGRVVDRLRVDGYVDALAAGGGGVWLVDRHRGVLERIDPLSGKTTSLVPLTAAGTVAIGGDTLWVVSDDGTVATVDGDSPAARLRGVAIGHGPLDNTLAADADGAWVVGRGDGTLVRIQAGEVVSRIAVAHALGPVATGDGAVWVVSSDGGDYRLARVDPATEKVTATLDAGRSQPAALVATGRNLWLIARDGTASLVRTRED